MKKLILCIIAAILICSSAAADINEAYTQEIVIQINEERAKYGYQSLVPDPDLMQAAYTRALEITEKFSHTRPDGSRWSTVSSKVLGENIAKGYGYPDKVMAAWLTSSGHRRNILKQGYGSVGVCAYEHNGVIYWVQLFGK